MKHILLISCLCIIVIKQAHVGTLNLNNHMKKYITHRGANGTHYINVEETW